MALCSAVITSALKRLGNSNPSTTEISDALPALQGLYDRLVDAGTFGRLNDIIVTSDYEAQEFDRIFVNTSDTVTITVPDTYERTALDPPTTRDDPDLTNRPARDLACIVVNVLESTDRVVLIRDAGLGGWVDASAITLTDQAPLSRRDFSGLACRLAVLLADEYSDRAPNPSTVAEAARFMSGIAHQAASPRYETAVDFF